ncbi:hypothetical protein QWU01_25150 [Kluyvera cryocrescens]|uniref:Minor tail protein n=1 Tax=Kluyvera cryocrescens TaxID=580 RepID=A0AAW9CCU8_KLUCR|nr:hypothetical protein [Kluyvera cryocrescens]MDW3780085.1 hypothetical protein [Kluyvera cryocrescens]
MSAGTLTLTNNSDAVTGSGTAFTTDLTAGDFVVSVVGGVTYSLPVKTVTSNTALVLAAPYQGPTQTKLAWSAVPFNTMNRVTAGMVTQATEALRGLNLDKQNWQSVFSAPGNITVELPDGSKYMGPSWLSVASQAGNLSALGIGGTGTSLAALDWQTFDFVPGAKFNVSSLNITNTPPGLTIPSGNYGVLINVTGYEGNNRHVEVWISTTTAANYYHYEIRVTSNNQPGQRAFTVRQIWTSADTIPLSNLALNDIGLNYTGMPTVANVDWQTVPLASGMIQIWNCSNWTNAPAGLPTTSLVSINVTAKAGRAIVEVSALNAAATRQSWTVEIEDANNLGSRRFAVQIDLTFSDDDSGKALARSRLGFNSNLGIGGQIGALAAFDWQTFAFETSAHYNVSADSWVSAPAELSSLAGNVAVVVVASSNTQAGSSAWNILELTTYDSNNSSRRIFSVVCRGAIGSRTFSVTPLLTKADLDSRVGYAMLDFGAMSRGERKVLNNPFGNSTPVEVVAEAYRNNTSGVAQWADEGWIFNPQTGSYGAKAGYLDGVGIVVQCGGVEIGNSSANTGTPRLTVTGSSTASVPIRVHVRKITS